MNEYIHKVIEFTEAGLASHPDYDTLAVDPGIQARVIDASEEKDGCVTIELDMSEFIKYNSKQMIPNWEDRSGQKLLKWNQTHFYPYKHKFAVTYYVDSVPFELR